MQMFFFFTYLNMYILFNMRIYCTKIICEKERSNVFNMFYVNLLENDW